MRIPGVPNPTDYRENAVRIPGVPNPTNYTVRIPGVPNPTNYRENCQNPWSAQPTDSRESLWSAQRYRLGVAFTA